MIKKYTTEEFISKAKEKHNDKYEYSKVEYINSSQKVIITCRQHGDFTQTPSKHLYGRGCRKCSNEAVSDRFKNHTEEFIKKSNNQA